MLRFFTNILFFQGSKSKEYLVYMIILRLCECIWRMNFLKVELFGHRICVFCNFDTFCQSAFQERLYSFHSHQEDIDVLDSFARLCQRCASSLPCVSKAIWGPTLVAVGAPEYQLLHSLAKDLSTLCF